MNVYVGTVIPSTFAGVALANHLQSKAIKSVPDDIRENKKSELHFCSDDVRSKGRGH